MNICHKIEKKTGLSGYALAKVLGVDPGQWYRWEKVEDWSISWEQLRALAKVKGGAEFLIEYLRLADKVGAAKVGKPLP